METQLWSGASSSSTASSSSSPGGRSQRKTLGYYTVTSPPLPFSLPCVIILWCVELSALTLGFVVRVGLALQRGARRVPLGRRAVGARPRRMGIGRAAERQHALQRPLAALGAAGDRPNPLIFFFCVPTLPLKPSGTLSKLSLPQIYSNSMKLGEDDQIMDLLSFLLVVRSFFAFLFTDFSKVGLAFTLCRSERNTIFSLER